MNTRERIFGVIEGRIPDRVPVCLYIPDEGNFLQQMYPDLDRSNPLECAKKLIELERDLGLDVFVRVLNGIYPEWVIHGGLNTETDTEKWEVSTHESKVAGSIVKQTIVRTPGGVLEQEFRVSDSESPPGTMWFSCTKKPVRSEKDLDILINFEPSMSPSFPAHVRKMAARVKQYLEDDGVLAVWAPGAVYNQAALLVDPNDLAGLFLVDYPFYERLMDYCLKRTLPFLKALGESDFDVFCVGGDAPGGFLGMRNYDTYVLPFEKKFVANVKKLGAKILYHNCGKSMVLAQSYQKLQVDMIEAFAPPPLGDGDLKKAKMLSEGSYTIVGNVDQINVMKQGSVDEVKRMTRETVETGKKGGRFVLQNADYLEHGTPEENVRAYVETGLEYGVY
jgi:hypothetical protein